MDFDFKSILKNIFGGAKSGESVVGIDIGTSSIKVVELKKKNGRAVLETYGTLSLGSYADLPVGSVTNLSVETTVKALTDVARESNVSTKKAVFAMPSSASLIFILELPGIVSPSDFPSVVPTEARKYIPVPINEVSLDYFVIPKRESSQEFDIADSTIPNVDSKTEVLVVAMHNDTITKYKDIVTGSGLSAETLEVESFSAIRADFHHEMSAVLLVDFGASKTKLSIVEYGVVRSFHIINRGSADITNSLATALGIDFKTAEEMKRAQGINTEGKAGEAIKLSLDYIFSETESTIWNYEKKYNKTVTKVIFSGGGSLLPGLVGAAQVKFKNEVILANPFSKVEAPAFLEPVLESIGPEFAIAIGASLRELGAE